MLKITQKLSQAVESCLCPMTSLFAYYLFIYSSPALRQRFDFLVVHALTTLKLSRSLANESIGRRRMLSRAYCNALLVTYFLFLWNVLEIVFVIRLSLSPARCLFCLRRRESSCDKLSYIRRKPSDPAVGLLGRKEYAYWPFAPQCSTII